MTTEEKIKQIYKNLQYRVNQGEFDTWDNHYISEFASLIDTHYQSVVQEIIGEDENYSYKAVVSTIEGFERNKLREEQRARAKQLLATPQERTDII